MAYSVATHILRSGDKAVRFVQTPNGGKPLRPKYLVLHYTAAKNFESTVTWFKNPSSEVSAHLVIGRAGEVVQMQAFNKSCWHAGLSAWKGVRGLNSCSIGIEIDNAGVLTRNARGQWVTWYGEVIPACDVVEAKHRLGGPVRGWHKYTDKQIEITTEIVRALYCAYKFSDILGHEDISWPRKSDPGPAFPLQQIKLRAKNG